MHFPFQPGSSCNLPPGKHGGLVEVMFVPAAPSNDWLLDRSWCYKCGKAVIGGGEGGNNHLLHFVALRDMTLQNAYVRTDIHACTQLKGPFKLR